MKRSFIVGINGGFYRVEILDVSSNNFKFCVNGKEVNVTIFNPIPETPKKFEILTFENLVRSVVVGVIKQVYVIENQVVKKGEPLISIEAMKMENIITARNNAKVKKIYKHSGDKVNKDEVILELEPLN